MFINKRPGFFSRLLAAITDAGKHPSRDVEEKQPQSEEQPENAPIGLPGSQWLFGCSVGAASEVAGKYDQPAFPDANGLTPGKDFLTKKDIVEEGKKQASLDDYWAHYESGYPDPYK